LLSTADSLEAFKVLQHMAPMSYDSSRLVDVACIGFSHITHPYLNQLRSIYFAQVAQLVQACPFGLSIRERKLMSS
jgi:hypothetical protein